MDQSSMHLIQLILTYKYLILFPLAMIEGVTVGIFAGFVSSLGYLNFLIAYVIVLTALAIADSGYYAIGYFGGKQIISKWGHFIGISLQKIEFISKHFKQHPQRTFLFGKATPFFGVGLLMAAGIAHYPYKRFFWINFFLEMPKTLLWMIIGYYSGEAYYQISKDINYASRAIAVVVAIVLVVSFLRTKFVKAI